jgi:hypothetical protein
VHDAQHEHTTQMEQWRREAAELIRYQEMRESLAASMAQRDQALADLKRRAGLGPHDEEPLLAAVPRVLSSH